MPSRCGGSFAEKLGVGLKQRVQAVQLGPYCVEWEVAVLPEVSAGLQVGHVCGGIWVEVLVGGGLRAKRSSRQRYRGLQTSVPISSY